MRSYNLAFLPIFVFGFLEMVPLNVAADTERQNGFKLRPFSVNLSAGVPRMLDLVKNTILPKEPEYPGLGSSAGIDLELLSSLQKEWITDFDWSREEAALNK